jgi:GTP-binding protein LepA
VVVLFRVLDGSLKKGDRIRIYSSGRECEVMKLGVFSPESVEVAQFGPGEVGFLCANMKELSDAPVGDTVTKADRPTDTPFPGFKKVKPMVFSGLYPVEPNEYEMLKWTLMKLQLNDRRLNLRAREPPRPWASASAAASWALAHSRIIQVAAGARVPARLITTAALGHLQGGHHRRPALADRTTRGLLPDPSYHRGPVRALTRGLEIHVPNDLVGNVLGLVARKSAASRRT